MSDETEVSCSSVLPDLVFCALLNKFRDSIRSSAYRWYVSGIDDPEDLAIEGESYFWEFYNGRREGVYRLGVEDEQFGKDFRSQWRKKLIDRIRYVRRQKRDPSKLRISEIETPDGVVSLWDLLAQSTYPSPLEVVEANDLCSRIVKCVNSLGSDAVKIIEELINPVLVPALEKRVGLAGSTKKWVLYEALGGSSKMIVKVLDAVRSELKLINCELGLEYPDWVQILCTFNTVMYDPLSECAEMVVGDYEITVGKTNKGRFYLDLSTSRMSEVSRYDTFDELLRDLYEVLINLCD